METECNRPAFEFQPLGSRQVTARFDGGTITSDAGGLLLAEVEASSGLLARLATCFDDHRDAEKIEHSVEALVKQRVFALALGYEDLNDHDQLRADPLLAVLVGKQDPTGQDRADPRDRGKPLAGKSTLNRLELTPVGADPGHRYKKIVARHRDLEGWFVEAFLTLTPEPPMEIVLDLDATDDPLHGQQAGRFFHGYYKHYCYLPLYIFCGEHLLCAKLRPADIDAAAGSVKQVARIVAQIRQRWPQVRIILRADSGFCRENLMRWCEDHGVDYVFGLAKNGRLTRVIGKELHEAQLAFVASGEPARVFKDFSYRTRKSWSRERRRGGQGGASGPGQQSAICGHVPVGRMRGCPAALRTTVLCPRRNGESHQGATVVPVRRSHELPDDACQPTAAVALQCCLCTAGGAAAKGAAQHLATARPFGHHSAQAAQGRGGRAGDGAPRLVRAGRELSVPKTVRSSILEPASLATTGRSGRSARTTSAGLNPAGPQEGTSRRRFRRGLGSSPRQTAEMPRPGQFQPASQRSSRPADRLRGPPACQK